MTQLQLRQPQTDQISTAVNACLDKSALAIIALTNQSNLQHSLSDELIQELTGNFINHVSAILRPNDDLIILDDARVVIVLDNLIDSHHLELAALKMKRVFEDPIPLGDTSVILDVYGGFLYLARQNSGQFNCEELLKRADAALTIAKNTGDNAEPYHISTLEDEGRVENHWQIGMRLREAMQAHQIYMDYQPKVELSSGSLIGAEALVRWRDNGTVVPPDEYLPALQSDLMWELTVYCFRRVLHDILDHGIELSVAVNLDPTVLAQEELIPLLRRETVLWGVDPQQIILEITEVGELFDTAQASEKLTEIRELGFRVSIDDFGSGHSNFERLRDLPIDEIKIDRSFSGDLINNTQNQTLTKNIIELAKVIGVPVVSEGIEDAETLELLLSWGCAIGQGFYLGAPISIEKFTELCQ